MRLKAVLFGISGLKIQCNGWKAAPSDRRDANSRSTTTVLQVSPCHPKIQRRCARKRHITVRLKAVLFGISGLKIQCNGSKAAPSDRRDAISGSTTTVLQLSPCHPKIQRRCARKRHITVRLKAVLFGIPGLKIQCNGSKAAPSDRRDANSRSTTTVLQLSPCHPKIQRRRARKRHITVRLKAVLFGISGLKIQCNGSKAAPSDRRDANSRSTTTVLQLSPCHPKIQRRCARRRHITVRLKAVSFGISGLKIQCNGSKAALSDRRDANSRLTTTVLQLPPCHPKIQRRCARTKGSSLRHLWFEDPVQWLESCTVRPERLKQQVNNDSPPTLLLSPKDSTEMCKEKAHNRATKGSSLWHLWFEDPVQWLESCTVRPERRKQQVNNDSPPTLPLSPKDSTETCKEKAHNRATKGSPLWHLWFEDPVQWLESCIVRPERRKQQVNNDSPPTPPPVTQRFNGDVQGEGT